MPSTYVDKKFALLTDNAGADGLVSIVSNAGWLPGATVFIVSTAVASTECIISEVIGNTQLRLRSKGTTRNGQIGFVGATPRGGRTDLHLYLLANGANISMEGQVVPVRAVFSANERG